MPFLTMGIRLSIPQVLSSQSYPNVQGAWSCIEKYVNKRWEISLLIDFQKKLLSPIVRLTCLVNFPSKLVERFKRDVERCLHVYPAGQCTSKRQAVWQHTASFKHLDNWSVEEGMLGCFKVIMGTTLLVQPLSWRRNFSRWMKKYQ